MGKRSRSGWLVLIGLACAAVSGNLGAQMAAGVSAPAAAAATLPPMAPTQAKIFPLAEIRRGQRAVAYTVFEGVTPEPMQVEILGVLDDAIGPGQDMILARLEGPKPEYTGVVAGMSGSPVYIDGRLVGAIAYRIGQFSKEAICGITPIEQMLEVRDGEPGARVRLAQSSTDRTGEQSWLNPLALDKEKPAQAVSAGGDEVEPIATPLVFSGFSQATVDRFGDKFRAMGLDPVAGLGGAAAAGTKQPEPLVPGSAVSAILVRGDLSISGTCTVTYVDPKQLLACGHPITQFGDVSMPMTKAEVLATLPSPMNAFKIINTTETVGSFTEDRASAILGQFGVPARMIPVSVEVVPPGTLEAGTVKEVSERVDGPAQRLPVPQPGIASGLKGNMHFEVLNNRELTPSAMLVSVYQSLSGTNESADDISYRMEGELTLKGLPPVKLEGVMSSTEQTSGAMDAAQYVNEKFSQLYANAVEQPQVLGLRLKMEEIPERRTAVLDSARVSRTEVHAGETLEVEATLHPYEAEPMVERLMVKLPDSLEPGPIRLVVSDGATVDRLTTPPGAAALAATHPTSLADVVEQMNSAHANDRIYVTLLDHTAQAELEAEALPNVPLSMANVLEPLKAAQKLQLTGESAEEAGSLETGYAVSGSQVLTLDVR